MAYYIPLPTFLVECPEWWKNFVGSVTDNKKDPHKSGAEIVTEALLEVGAKFVFIDEDNVMHDSDELDNPDDTTGVLFKSREDALAFKLKWV